MNTQEKTLNQLVQSLADIDSFYHQVSTTADDQSQPNVYKEARDLKRLHKLELCRLFGQEMIGQVVTSTAESRHQCPEKELLTHIITTEKRIVRLYKEISKNAELNAFQLHVLTSHAKSDEIMLKRLEKLDYA